MRNTTMPIDPKEDHYIGLDLSLTASGVVVLNAGGTVKEHHVIKVKTKGVERLNNIQGEIRSIIGMYNIKRVCIEEYAFGAQGKTFHIGELGGVVKLLLYRMKVRHEGVPPTVLKKFTTGKGGGEGANKDQMTLYAFKNWAFTGVDNNEVDAFCLARFAMALEGLGGPFNKTQTETITQHLNPVIKKSKKGKSNES